MPISESTARIESKETFRFEEKEGEKKHRETTAIYDRLYDERNIETSPKKTTYKTKLTNNFEVKW